MADLKVVKTRIESVKKTRQITRAMKLVAGAKLRRATEAAVSARPYKNKISDVLKSVATKAGDSVSDPLLERRHTVKRILVVVLTSDRGLCGGFNGILLRRTMDFLNARKAEGVEVDLFGYGRKGCDFLVNRGYTLTQRHVDVGGREKLPFVLPLTNALIAGFLDGTWDEVYVAYNEFVNAITQKPTFRAVLPLAVEAGEDTGASVDFKYEPEPKALLGALLPLYLRTLVLQSFLETEAGEHAARMTAMDNATRNAGDLIDRLTLEYNRARQAAITKEIIEIVSGAQAL